MSKIEELTLIKGTFSYEEAKEILMNVVSAKIHFHEIKNFSSLEHFGKQDETALKRISPLKSSLEKIKEIAAEAKATNKQLIIKSMINIEFADR